MTPPATQQSVACIGVGNVGRSWAMVFAIAGYATRLYDENARTITQHALPAIKKSLNDMVAANLLENATPIIENIRVCDSIEDAVQGVIHVQESVHEDIQIKQNVFRELGKFSPTNATLASSTSAIPGSEFMNYADHPERCVIAHPVNPPHLIPLVEICASPWTSDETVDACYEFMRSVGQEPIRVNKEIPGFILNRLQFTLVGEAMHLVGEGYCSAEDVDKVLKHGLALRWAFIGPFEVGHLNATEGFQGFVDNLGHMMRALAKDSKADYEWGPDLARKIHALLIEKTPVEELPDRQAWRDRRIMALRKHLLRT